MRQGLPGELVGRDAERAELSAAIADASTGRGGVVLLLGEAGIGKSTLAAWAVDRATAIGMRAVQAACSAAGMPALWPVRRALREVAAGLPWREDAATPAGSEREVLAAAVVEAITTAADARPLLILFENVHWADPASLLLVRAIADAVPVLPVLLVLTMRDDPAELTPEAREHLGRLPTHARRLLLPPLDAGEVAALTAQVLGPDRDEQQLGELHHRTGGNPFFVHEVLRLQAAHGRQAALVVPPGVSEVIQRRVARLGQPCAALLAVAAIAAETCADVIEPDLIGADADVAALLVEAAAARLVVETSTGYAFRHALIREVVAAALSAPERARLHALVATRLEQRAGPSDSPARLAHHWARAHGDVARERAAHWSLVAARTAVAEFGFEAAVEHFRRALAAARVDRVGVLVELGAALQLSGDVDGARDVLAGAAREAERAGRPVEIARAALALGGGLAGFEVPIADELQARLLTRADELLPESERAWRAAVRGRLSLVRADALPADERIALAEDAVRLARAAGDPRIEAGVLAAYCDAIAGPDYVAERIAAAGRIVALTEPAESLQEQATLLLARRLLLVAHLENGDLGAAEAQAYAYERTASRLGIPLYAWLPEIWRGMRALLVGDVDAALHRADLAEQLGRRAHSFNAELMVFTLRMQAHLDRGTAEQYAPTVRGIVDRIGRHSLPAMYLAGPARFLLAAGDTNDARTVLRTFAAGPDAMPKDSEWLESHWALADIAIRFDDRVAVERLYDVLRGYEHLWVVDGIGGAVFGAVPEQLARLAEHLGRADAAESHRAAARAQYERQGTPALLRRTHDACTESPPTARIHRDGTTWHLDWQGRRTTLPDAKGLRDLAVLLTRPDQPVPALDLVRAADGPAATSAGGGLGPVLDDTARRAYRARLAELDRDLEQATADADLGRAERIDTERAMLLDELAAAAGLGGRARIAGDPADRARKAVTMRVRAAIRAIEGHDRALARHLTNAVRTGRFCSYSPDVPVRWRT